MSKDSRKQNISALKIWHRRLGLSAAIFVLVLSISGLCLNHISEWRLDNKVLNSSALLSWYGINGAETLYSYALGERLVTKIGDEVFIDTRELAHGTGQLIGAVKILSHSPVIIAFDNELLLLTPEYEIVERLGAAHSVPLPLQRIGLSGHELVLQAGDRVYLADLDKLKWQRIDDLRDIKTHNGQSPNAQKGIIWSEPISTPDAVANVLQNHFVGEGITVERLLLDIHSGRIGGIMGVYLVDLMAILFIILGITGSVTWFLENREGK